MVFNAHTILKRNWVVLYCIINIKCLPAPIPLWFPVIALISLPYVVQRLYNIWQINRSYGSWIYTYQWNQCLSQWIACITLSIFTSSLKYEKIIFNCLWHSLINDVSLKYHTKNYHHSNLILFLLVQFLPKSNKNALWNIIWKKCGFIWNILVTKYLLRLYIFCFKNIWC
jgi:hypothetical protein